MTALLPRYCELDHLGVIGVAGPDAQSFLQGQLTCDVNTLSLNSSTYGSYCNPKGRVLATFLLWHSAGGYFLQLPAGLREAIQKRLALYVLRAKVSVTDAGAGGTTLGLAGQDTAARIERVLGAVPRAEHALAQTPEATAIRLPLERYLVLAARDTAPAILAKVAQDAAAAAPEYWDWLDIRAGVPAITAPTQGEFVPQMLNQDLIGGLSFSKGCYPGQEIVARMHFLGRLKSRLYLASVAAEPGNGPRPGDKLYSPDLGEQASGTIVNAARSCVKRSPDLCTDSSSNPSNGSTIP